jgi:uncharacterized oligopeptide transporter (OPT) family protein
MVIEGIMGGELPWALIMIGVVIAVIVEVIGIPVLPFAIGVYLPVQLNACIMVGGLIRLFFDRMKESDKKKGIINNGILYCSGMIAGEGLVGILLALLAVFGVGEMLDLSGLLNLPAWASSIGSIVVFGLMICSLLLFTVWKKDKKSK